MVNLNNIRQYFPADIRDNALFGKSMLKEYIQLSILDFLSTSHYIRKLCLIGGTNLRLVNGIDRFSEDIDFDCKEMGREEFFTMNNDILSFLLRSGYKAEFRDKTNKKLTALRRSIFFPEFLFDLGLSGHREERFLIKVEAEDQGVPYKPVTVNILGCGFFFPFPVPPDQVLCSMKATALLERGKGRDFYDFMFLLGKIKPDYHFLSERTGIKNSDELKSALKIICSNTDLQKKARDFEHLLINKETALGILRFGEFIEEML